MDSMIVHLVWNHICSQHGVITLIAVLLVRVDSLLRLALLVCPADKLKAGIDWVAAWLDKRVDQDAQQPPKP